MRYPGIEPGQRWWAAVGREKWPLGLAADIAPLWHEPYGDRQTELVACVRAEADRAAVEAQLRAALLSDAELARGPKAWAAQLEDPYREGWEHTVLRTREPEGLSYLDSSALKVEQRKLTFASKPEDVQLRERRMRAFQMGACVPCE